MKRTYISPSIHCIVMEESLLDTDWSGGEASNSQTGTNENVPVNNNPLPDPGDGGKSLGAKSNHFFDWDE